MAQSRLGLPSPVLATLDLRGAQRPILRKKMRVFSVLQKNLMPIYTVSLAIFIFTVSILRVAGGEVGNIPEIGAHQPILIVGKNVHPQNLMVVYTKVDGDGRFLTNPADRDRPLFDFYWLMDGKNHKPVNGLIKNEICKRLECQLSPGGRATHFTVNVNDLKEVESDIKEPKIDVYANGSGGARDVEALMNLGPSDGNMRIKLSSIYTEGRAFPPAVYAVTLKGEEVVNGKLTGKKVARRYEAKR